MLRPFSPPQSIPTLTLTRIRFFSLPASASPSQTPTRQDLLPLSSSSSSSSTPYSFVQLLSYAAKSSNLSAGQQSHSLILKLGLTSNVFISTALLDLYSKCRNFADAHQLFDEMPHRNSVTWNALIYSHSQSPTPALAVRTFKQMILLGFSLTAFGLSSVLVSASRAGDLRTGAMLHCVAAKRGLSCSNVVLGTSLVDMYSKCCDMTSARRVFDEMDERNVITWTSLVTGYALDQSPGEAMSLFREMKRWGVGINSVTYNSLLTSFAAFEDLGHGKQVHCLVIKERLDFDPFVSVTLVTMYSKCGSLEDFIRMYPAVSIQDQVSCNSIIAGLSHLGHDREVLERFLRMRKEYIEPDLFTFACVLRTIGIFSALQEGRQAHALILKSGHAANVSVQNGLVSMYARCGVIGDSKKVFSSMDEPDVVSWNSLLSGCAQHGYGREAVELFENMRTTGVALDSTSFLSVLSACSHVGLVDKGLEYFHLMKRGDSPVVAGKEHYASIADLLGRAGYLDEAEAFIGRMPMRADVPVYRALLSACQVHGNAEMAKRAAERLLDLCPDDPSAHVLLSNVFAAGESWENASGVRRVMWGKGVRKQPAWSSVDERSYVV